MSLQQFSANIIVEIGEWEEFIKYAKTSKLFLYDPILFSTPFIDERKIRCVNCYAIGINFQGLPVILKFQKSQKNTSIKANFERKSPKDSINAEMRIFIEELKTRFQAIQGSIHWDGTKPVTRQLY